MEVRDDVPGLVVCKGRLLIGTDATVNKHRMAATLHHEIATHVLTYVNGLHQPFKQMHGGMVGGADFIETFRLLRHDQGFAARAAFVMAMRIARRLLECADTCAWADPSQLGTGAVG